MTDQHLSKLRFAWHSIRFSFFLCLLVYACIRFLMTDPAARMVDMRSFEPHGHWVDSEKQRGRWGLNKVYESWQAALDSQRPFRVVLRHDRPLHVGDWFAARTKLGVEMDNACISLFANTYLNADQPRYFPEILVTVRANEKSVTYPIHELGSDKHISVRNIQPVNGVIEVEFRLDSFSDTRARNSLRATTVYFDYLEYYKC